MELKAFACQVSGCGGPRSGVCINSLPFDECPDVVPFVEDDAGVPSETTDDPSLAEMVVTSRGRSLDTIACDALLRERGGILVGIVAGPEVGKTTLIATIYELIHRGKMAGFGFAGSETLGGYEERSFLARIASNRTKPDTFRTPHKQEVSFTHLRLAMQDCVKDVYFSDRSGEHFDEALGKPDEFGFFAELGRAETILLMVDLEQLMRSPQPVMSSVRRQFMAMKQSHLLFDKQVILLGTKADIFTAANERDEASKRLEMLRDDLRNRADAGTNVSALMVASRAPKGSNTVGAGLDKLLADILAPSAPRSFRLGTSRPKKRTELDALMDALWRDQR